MGRRTVTRYRVPCEISLKPGGQFKGEFPIKGLTDFVSEYGFSCKLEKPLPVGVKIVEAVINSNGDESTLIGQVVWTDVSKLHYGVKFDGQPFAWPDSSIAVPQDRKTSERRSAERRTGDAAIGADQRKTGRRFSDLLDSFSSDDEIIQGPKVKTFLRSKSISHTSEVIASRREWIAQLTGTPIKHAACFSEDFTEFAGKIENPIGVVHTPLGIAGPLKVNGDYAKGIFFVPLATTEGALVTSYTLGSHIVTRSGGAHVTVLKDELRVAPYFVFKTLSQARAFVAWTERHFTRLKELAEETSEYLKLLKTSSIINGRRVILNFHYETADAMGMNMACKATENASLYIASSVRPEEYWLRSNFNANKKVTANNFINGYGKTVTAEVTIPRKIISMLKTTPEDMAQYFYRTLLADAHAVQIGANGHFANAIAAIYIACGQDVASVANSHVGISTCEVTKDGDLYFSVYLSNLLLGTVGGGTSFGTAHECLAMLDCVGIGKAKKFAEIVTATVLAGEIGVCASIVNGTYVFAHETFGRNRPNQ